MYVDFSGLFHQSTKDRSGQGRVSIPKDKSLFPPEWTDVVYKEYPRLEKIPLGDEAPAEGVLGTIAARRSERTFRGTNLNPKSLSHLLRYSCGITGEGEDYHRAQPSGGARYPIEAYVTAFRDIGTIRSGVYHYSVRLHALDSLWQRTFSEDDVARLFTSPWVAQAPCAIVLAGVCARNQRKYGERGYRQVLLEAGAVLQNLYLVATELGLSCCAIDSVREPDIEKLLDLDGYAESVICTAIVG